MMWIGAEMADIPVRCRLVPACRRRPSPSADTDNLPGLALRGKVGAGGQKRWLRLGDERQRLLKRVRIIGVRQEHGVAFQQQR